MKTIIKFCLHCNNEFNASLKEHKRGNAKFCCKKCSSEHRKALPKKQNKPNCICDNCDKPIYKSISRQKLSKSCFLFCSRSCKDEAQKIENYHKFKDMMPPHYHEDGIYSGNAKYRKLAFQHKPHMCERCNYNKIIDILIVHHKDRNRSNSDLNNLEILCHNCHEEDHYLNKDGRYTPKKLVECVDNDST